jgi:hypothetical protein
LYKNPQKHGSDAKLQQAHDVVGPSENSPRKLDPHKGERAHNAYQGKAPPVT